ncbi:MAG: glycosyltransferase family 1 protein [Phycisphaera sp.]|nr:MAG: glycosyltransferase family 1 protein [Phycisphaera sp.]
MRVLIFEPDHGGHRYTYVRHLLTGLKPLEGIESIKVAISRKGQVSDEYAEQIKPFEDSVEILPELEVHGSSPLDNAKQLLSALRGTLAKHPTDHLYVPSADGLSQVIGARAMVPGGRVIPKDTVSEAVQHRGSFAYQPKDITDKVKFALSYKTIEKAPWTKLHFVDPIAYEGAKVLSKKLRDTCDMLADPVDEVQSINKKQARKNLDIPQDGRYVGVAGAINERKGCDILLAAFDMAKLKDNDRVLLAGKASDGIRELIKNRYQHHIEAGRLIFFDRYLTNDELAWSLSAMDVVCPAGHGHIGLSNVALRAAAANRLILGSTAGWTGRVVPAFGLGVVCDLSKPREFAEGLEQSLDAAEWYKRTPAGSKLLEFHSQANHIAGWTKLIRERLGLPAPEIKTWDSLVKSVKQEAAARS